MTEKQKLCYLCNSGHFAVRKGSVRGNETLQVLECTSCGLVTLSSFSHLSQTHYQDGKMHGEEPLSIEAWIKETETDDRRRYEMFKEKITGKRVLDFGCGNGAFLLKARNVAFDVRGVELETRLQPFFKEKKLHVWNSVESALASGEKFDIITSFHVFEHLEDPKAMLRALSNLLTDSGEIILEVPSSDDALLTLYDSDAFSNFTYWDQHLYLFNSHTLPLMVKEAGFKVKWSKQYQRYSLANHLYWLVKGKPAGHKEWAFMQGSSLAEAYAAELASLGKCDTLLIGVAKKDF